MQRTDHETLDNSDPNNMVDIQTMFLKMNLNLTFDDAFLRKNQLDGFLRVPMSVESFEVPLPVINAMKSMIFEFSGIGNEANISNNEAFIAEIRKNQEVLMQFPDKENQWNRIF